MSRQQTPLIEPNAAPPEPTEAQLRQQQIERWTALKGRIDRGESITPTQRSMCDEALRNLGVPSTRGWS